MQVGRQLYSAGLGASGNLVVGEVCSLQGLVGEPPRWEPRWWLPPWIWRGQFSSLQKSPSEETLTLKCGQGQWCSPASPQPPHLCGSLMYTINGLWKPWAGWFKSRSSLQRPFSFWLWGLIVLSQWSQTGPSLKFSPVGTMHNSNQSNQYQTCHLNHARFGWVLVVAVVVVVVVLFLFLG